MNKNKPTKQLKNITEIAIRGFSLVKRYMAVLVVVCFLIASVFLWQEKDFSSYQAIGWVDPSLQVGSIVPAVPPSVNKLAYLPPFVMQWKMFYLKCPNRLGGCDKYQ